MPKINVYLPDDLADAVKEAAIPVSAICQRSLEQAVRRVADVRAAVAGELSPEDALGRLTALTPRTREALTLAIEQVEADGAPALDTGHILNGILSEGTNLALHVLRAVDVDLDQLARDLGSRSTAEPLSAGAADGVRRFSAPASSALQAAVTEAISLDHNYIGCEHLLLGLVAETDGIAGRALRAQGAEHKTVRRAVVAALAGYVHLRAQTSTTPAAAEGLVADAVRRELAPITERLTALERHVGVGRA
ncbi:MAG TPA: Clp protease N-terminal domain-containing protein [Pseudonocardia sp.]